MNTINYPGEKKRVLSVNVATHGERMFEAKFRVPAGTRPVISRPRLYAHLDASRDCKLIVVSAPAGFGKTTLVAAWLRACADLPRPDVACRKAAWLTLDKRDNDLVTFVGNLSAAIQRACPEFCFDAFQLPQLPVQHTVSDIARALVYDLAHLETEVTLTLDDYHLISEPVIHTLLELLLAYSPEAFRLIVIARYDPPLPVARMCLQGAARQLRATDLRFRPDEAEAFLRLTLPAPVPPATIAAVTEQAGGWIAHLRLAALLMQQAPDQVSADSAQHMALDYLMEELLTNERPEARAFLLATSILDRFCPDLARALFTPAPGAPTLRSDALKAAEGSSVAAFARYVAHSGIFLAELETAGEWRRYHELFRELLYQRLQWEGAADIPALRRRAFEWLKAAGHVEEALTQAQAMNDMEAAAGLIDANILTALRRCDWQTAQRWLAAVPMEAIRRRPAALLARCYILANIGAVERLGRAIRRAEEALAEVELENADQMNVWWGALDVMRSEYALRMNQAQESVAFAERGLKLLPTAYPFERAFAAIRLEAALARLGRVEAGRAALRAQLDEIEDDRSPWAFCVRLSLAFSYVRAAELPRAQRELELLEQLGVTDQPYNECWLQYARGCIAYEWNDLDTAEQSLRRAAQSHGGNYLRACEAALMLALTRQARGDWREADQALEQAHSMARGLSNPDLTAMAFSFRTRLLIMRRPSPVSAHPQELARPAFYALYLPPEIPGLTEARRLLAIGRPTGLLQAETLLSEAVDFFNKTHTTLLLIPALCLLALTQQAQGQRSKALTTLKAAVERAAPGNMVRAFLDSGPELIGLLNELKLSGMARAHADAILAAAAQEPAVVARSRASETVIEPLTTRERAVLALVARDLADKEIAAELGISPLTVRKHTANIYAKLQVRNRRQATARAQQLGLIRPEPAVFV